MRRRRSRYAAGVVVLQLLLLGACDVTAATVVVAVAAAAATDVMLLLLLMRLVVIVIHSASLSAWRNEINEFPIVVHLVCGIFVYLLEVANDLSLVFWIFVRRTCHVPVAERWWRCRTRRFDQLVIVFVNIIIEFLFVPIAVIANAFQLINSLLFLYKKALL